ncbi:DUF6541 family protein, partial [Microbacterium sp.]|uniref:DUF6541 family protein n=1 Tax=Microbacterium sp. TaxID=51671 RepID=UPI0027594159|nr:hypothetical protein [Microbacterium sp.]
MDPLIVFITIIVAAVVLFLPGGIAAAILGFRGVGLVGVASSLSLAGIALFSLIGIVVPVPWTGLTWAISAFLVVAIAVVIRRWTRKRFEWERPSTTPRWMGLVPFVAIAMAAVAIGIRVFPILADEGISQTFDNIYHLNGVRYVLDTEIIAPTRQIIPGFYPSLWHALTATIAMLSGSSIPLAVNVTSITIAMLVWPTSVVFLTRQIVGPNVVASLTSGALAAGIAGFPMLMLDYGVLYPNLLSIALLPAVLAVLLQVAGVGDGDRAPLPIRWTLVLVSVTVLALAHPSTLMAFFAIGLWPAAVAGSRWLRQARKGPRAALVWGLSGWIIGVGSVIVLLLVARPTRGQAFWMPSATILDAASQVLWNSVAWKPASPTIMITMLLGVLTILVLR